MAKIILKTPEGIPPYHTIIDTDVMEVEVRESYLGVIFVSDSGERLAVSMRDNGFEVHYWGDFVEKGFDTGWTDFKDGHIRVRNNFK
jgi:hypothetical protein